MTSLNPLHTIERQIGENLLVHRRMSPRAARERVLELLQLVQLPEAESRLGAYPHQLSGGQRQRVMIAMAIANQPDILIADEPTTALDVTIQANILTLLRDLRDRLGMALLLITHDLTIVRRMAERVCVMTRARSLKPGRLARCSIGRSTFTHGDCLPPSPRDVLPQLIARRQCWSRRRTRASGFRSAPECCAGSEAT